MADFVAKMAEQAAIGFVEHGAPSLAFGVIGLRQRERDATILVPGHDVRGGPVRRVRQHIENQSAGNSIRFGDRQAELQQ